MLMVFNAGLITSSDNQVKIIKCKIPSLNISTKYPSYKE